MLSVEPIPAFNDNYIWLITYRDLDRAFVVDPGDAAPVQRVLEERGLRLEGILVTHHHFDHVGGLEALREAWDPVVYGPDNPAIAGIDHPLGAGDRIEVLDHLFEVLAVPGHTLDHIAYFHPADDNPLLFCGDTLFAGGCGRLFEGTPAMMHQSLQALAALPANTRVYCAHEYTLANLAFAEAVEPGNEQLAARIASARASRERGAPTVPSSIALERETNPFLRCNRDEVATELKRQGRLEGESAVEVFAAVRAWKDSF
jgi:hydroxyacylglutathione hydrolase